MQLYQSFYILNIPVRLFAIPETWLIAFIKDPAVLTILLRSNDPS